MESSITLILDDVLRVHSQGRMWLLSLTEVRAIRSNENYTVIHFVDARTLTVRLPLKTWVEGLPDALFTRVHRTTLVSRRHLQSLQHVGPKQWRVWLHGVREPVPVGRLYYRALRASWSVRPTTTSAETGRAVADAG